MGEFLAEALIDTLQSGQNLVTIRDSMGMPPQGIKGVDFVFRKRGSASEDVIRVGLDNDGKVVSAQLIRNVRQAPEETGTLAPDLLEAIRTGASISALHWVDAPGSRSQRALSITVRPDQRVQIPLDE